MNSKHSFLELSENMNAAKECYTVLELQADASIEEIKESYRDLVTVWHPDRFVNNSRLHKKAENKLKSINVSYEYLLDTLNGKEVDSFLSLAQIIVIPQEIELEVGEYRAFSAIGIDNNGNSCDIEVEWSSEDGSIDSGGTFHSDSSGYFMITANVGNIKGSACVEVKQSEPYISPEPGIWDTPEKVTFNGLVDEQIFNLLDEPKRRVPWIRLLIWGGLAVLTVIDPNSDFANSSEALVGVSSFAWIVGMVRPGLVLKFGLPSNRWIVTLIYWSILFILMQLSST